MQRRRIPLALLVAALTARPNATAPRPPAHATFIAVRPRPTSDHHFRGS